MSPRLLLVVLVVLIHAVQGRIWSDVPESDASVLELRLIRFSTVALPIVAAFLIEPGGICVETFMLMMSEFPHPEHRSEFLSREGWSDDLSRSRRL